MCELNGGACLGLGGKQGSSRSSLKDELFIARKRERESKHVFYFRNTFNIVTFVKYLPLVLASLFGNPSKLSPFAKNSKTVNEFINYMQQVYKVGANGRGSCQICHSSAQRCLIPPFPTIALLLTTGAGRRSRESVSK